MYNEAIIKYPITPQVYQETDRSHATKFLNDPRSFLFKRKQRYNIVKLIKELLFTSNVCNNSIQMYSTGYANNHVSKQCIHSNIQNVNDKVNKVFFKLPPCHGNRQKAQNYKNNTKEYTVKNKASLKNTLPCYLITRLLT